MTARITAPQARYLIYLQTRLGEPLSWHHLSKDQASAAIDDCQARLGMARRSYQAAPDGSTRAA